MEVEKYNLLTVAIKEGIALIRLLKGFRDDELIKEYGHIRTGLIFKISSLNIELRDNRIARNKIRKGIALNESTEEDIIWIRHQFDTCSYDELTHCIKARFNDIREYRNYLANQEVNAKYPMMRKYVERGLDVTEKEVRRLLKMRRVLKKSVYRNWDSKLLDVPMEEVIECDLRKLILGDNQFIKTFKYEACKSCKYTSNKSRHCKTCDGISGYYELYDADPNCVHDIGSGGGMSGVKCKKCNGWFCF